jgi:hypothetical protein
LAETSTDNENVLNDLSWSCVNNANCVRSLARNVVHKLRDRKAVNFGVFSIEPVKRIPLKDAEGRSSKLTNFLSGHAVSVPLGPMVFGIERSEDYPNYLEVSIRKNVEGNTFK